MEYKPLDIKYKKCNHYSPAIFFLKIITAKNKIYPQYNSKKKQNN